MAETKRSARRVETSGEAAVDGLLAGVGAGLLMAAYLLVVGLASGESVAAILGRFDPSANAAAPVGIMAHLAVSGVYGAIFGLGRRLALAWKPFQAVPGWVTGLGYGMALWFLAKSGLLLGGASPLRQISAVHFMLAHLIYGGALGVLSHRRRE